MNNVIRDVLFPDAELEELMCIPDGQRNNLREFIGRYFIEDALPDEPVTDEKVRVIWYETEGAALGTVHVLRKYLAFDVYVHNDCLYNVSNDRLKRRDKQIGQRLKELLTGKSHVCGLRFQYVDEYHLGAKTIGYRRYHIVFSYVTTW
ncbi:MAG: hypothetical protein ACI4MK_08755 [Aristaeellaceae bacterium]